MARPTSFGSWLRGQREARGVTVAEIVETSKISMRYLQALETDRFDVLPAPVFVRGFLREYSRIVGLDADEVMNYFLISAPVASTESRRQLGHGVPVAAPMPSRVGLGLALTVAVVLLLAIAAAVAYWMWTPAAAPSPPSAAARTDSVLDATPSSIPAPNPEPTTAAKLAIPDPALEARVVPALALRLVLDFQQDCWVETRVDGSARSSELKAGGETLALEASESILLTLGNAPAVRVELNGRLLTLPTSGSRLVREFRIDRSLLAQAPEPTAAEPP